MKFQSNTNGFTLIELMIVIAILGIIAGIAIPNFIAYRNKTFCSATESDAHNIASAITDYFAIPSHTQMPRTEDLNGGKGVHLSGSNTMSTIEGDPNGIIKIRVYDGSKKCPTAYKEASTSNPNASWGEQAFTLILGSR